MKELSIKQKKFADEYIKTGNAENSAIKAGYSPKYARGNAHKLVAISCIKEYIDKKMTRLEEKTIAKAEEILLYLTNVLRGEETEEVPLKNTTVRKQVSVKDRLKAAELLGKRYALFIDKQELSGNVQVNNPFANLSTEDLKKLIDNE